MNRTAHPNPGPNRRTLHLLGAAVLLCLFSAWLTYRIILGIHLDHERRLSSQRLDAFALSLDATLARHESLPGLLALDPSLTRLLQIPDDPTRINAANNYLEAAQQTTAVSAAYLINIEGKTLAASNWRLPRSFVGHNYAFRPYFSDALKNGLGRFYGVGVTTGEPGYFLAAPVREKDKALGIIVVKVGLEAMEQAMTGTSETLLLADHDGIVFLSSDRKLRYHALAPLDKSIASQLSETLQYGREPIRQLADRAIQINESRPVNLSLLGETPQERLITARPVGNLGWHVVQLGNTNEAHAAALSIASAVAFAMAFLLGTAAHFRQRTRRREELNRIYAELENRIADRTIDLTEKITALEQTEAILRETRDHAVQAGKLAVLGQMSAGISHELNQPLAALQTFADNASALLARGRHDEVAENLAMISDLIDRTGRIVRQLKTFARKESATPQPVTVSSAIEHALMIVEPRRRDIAASIEVSPVSSELQAFAEAGRLEQVLVNLLRNGLDAMLGQTAPCLEISTQQDGKLIHIIIRDHGPGLPDEVLRHLFEPFYTTKPAGEGLGLGLAISLTIIESYGGTLTAHNSADGGAIFTLTLPAA